MGLGELYKIMERLCGAVICLCSVLIFKSGTHTREELSSYCVFLLSGVFSRLHFLEREIKKCITFDQSSVSRSMCHPLPPEQYSKLARQNEHHAQLPYSIELSINPSRAGSLALRKLKYNMKL